METKREREKEVSTALCFLPATIIAVLFVGIVSAQPSLTFHCFCERCDFIARVKDNLGNLVTYTYDVRET